MKPLLVLILLGSALYWTYAQTQQVKELQASLDQTRAQLQEAQEQLQAAKLQVQATTAKKTTTSDWMWSTNPLNVPAKK